MILNQENQKKILGGNTMNKARQLLKTVNEADDTVRQFALALFVDRFASELEEDDALDDVRGDFILPRQDIMDTVPDELSDGYDLNVDKYLDLKNAKKAIAEVDKAWGGKLTVKELYKKFDEVPAILALSLIGHGVSIDDNQKVEKILKEKGVSVPSDVSADLEMKPNDNAYQAISDVKAKL